MTTSEKIRLLMDELRAAKEVVASVNLHLSAARDDQFRERHGFAHGDWVLFDGQPAWVEDSEPFQCSVRMVTKAGKRSESKRYVYGQYSDHIVPWPADRPEPEVKP